MGLVEKMNQRIQELAKQAGLDIIFHLEEMGVDGEAELWKFAELIVRECADTVLGFHNQFGDSAHNEIREHFGVKE